MKFVETPLKGAYLIELEKRGDYRGFFARAFCEREYADQGLVSNFVQINNSLSTSKGTLRGMHYQLSPDAEVKVVRCLKGALWDCIADLRPDSPTYGKWYGAELTAENRRSLYVPKGFAHAVLTLEEDTEALYLVSAFYSPQSERGVRWNDPWLSIEWPLEPSEISDKDAGWPNFDPEFHGVERLRGLL